MFFYKINKYSLYINMNPDLLYLYNTLKVSLQELKELNKNLNKNINKNIIKKNKTIKKKRKIKNKTKKIRH